MLCDQCKKNQATMHTVTIINGAKQEYYLCPECANGAQFKLPSLMDVLSGFYGGLPAQEQTACACSSTLKRFQESGLLGCPQCYQEYRQQLIPVIKRVQGGRLRHVGRRPQGGGTPPATEETQVAKELTEAERLKLELDEAVANEAYERAAELRDRLRSLQKEE